MPDRQELTIREQLEARETQYLSHSALQIISQAEAEDAGIFASQGGSLQDEAYTYTGGVSKCKNDREGAALK